MSILILIVDFVDTADTIYCILSLICRVSTKLSFPYTHYNTKLVFSHLNILEAISEKLNFERENHSFSLGGGPKQGEMLHL